MKVEAGLHLEKARELLVSAKGMYSNGYYNSAGRETYLVMYHAAQSFIYEKDGKPAKTHGGTHSRFSELTINEPRITPELRRAMPKAYDMKAIADYELGSNAKIPAHVVEQSLEAAERFLSCVTDLVATSVVVVAVPNSTVMP